MNNENDFNEEPKNEEVKKIKIKKKKSQHRLHAALAIMLCLVLALSTLLVGAGVFVNLSGIEVNSLLGIETEKVTIIREAQEEPLIVGTQSDCKEIACSDDQSIVSYVAEYAMPSVVGIESNYTYVGGFGYNSTPGSGLGSGIIISEDGYILTNNHVVEAALEDGNNDISSDASIDVYLYGDTTEPYTAQVIGRNETLDVALLKINASGLTPATIGDSDDITVGEIAIAIGNPAGVQYLNSVTAGIISGINRQLGSDPQEEVEMNLIQTDVAINPGNSGGPLLNGSGEVIGITTIKIVDVDFEGLGFAIPINSVMEIVDELMVNGYVGDGTPNIGVSISSNYTQTYAIDNELPEGALVTVVGEGSPADIAGIEEFDIIIKLDEIDISSYDDLAQAKKQYNPYDHTIITVYRLNNLEDFLSGGEYLELELIFGETRK